MRWFPVIPVLLGLLFTTTAYSSNTSDHFLLRHIDNCLDKQFTHGQATERNSTINISKICPALYQQRFHSLLTSFDPPLEKETTVSQLLDIRLFLQDEINISTQEQLTNTVDLSQLPALVEKIYIPPEHKPVEPDIWDRIIEWLREMLIKQHEQSPDWLKSYLDSIEMPEIDTLILILKLCVAGLILFVLITVFNELRAANIFDALRHRGKKEKSASAAQFEFYSDNKPQQSDGQTTDKEFASQMLYQSLVFLMYHNILPEKFSYTNAELLQRACTNDGNLLAMLQRLFNKTEAVLYGDYKYSNEQRREIQELVERVMQQGGNAT